MRREDREISDQKEIFSILDASQICHVAMVDNGKPYVVPVNFAREGMKIYFHGATRGRKIEVLLANPAVCVEVESGFRVVPAESGCAWSAAYQSVIAEGAASVVSEPSEKKAALDLLMKKLSGRDDWEYSDKVLASTAIIRIDLESITGKRSGTPGT